MSATYPVHSTAAEAVAAVGAVVAAPRNCHTTLEIHTDSVSLIEAQREWSSETRTRHRDNNRLRAYMSALDAELASKPGTRLSLLHIEGHGDANRSVEAYANHLADSLASAAARIYGERGTDAAARERTDEETLHLAAADGPYYVPYTKASNVFADTRTKPDLVHVTCGWREAAKDIASKRWTRTILRKGSSQGKTAERHKKGPEAFVAAVSTLIRSARPRPTAPARLSPKEQVFAAGVFTDTLPTLVSLRDSAVSRDGTALREAFKRRADMQHVRAGFVPAYDKSAGEASGISRFSSTCTLCNAEEDDHWHFVYCAALEEVWQDEIYVAVQNAVASSRIMSSKRDNSSDATAALCNEVKNVILCPGAAPTRRCGLLPESELSAFYEPRTSPKTKKIFTNELRLESLSAAARVFENRWRQLCAAGHGYG